MPGASGDVEPGGGFSDDQAFGRRVRGLGSLSECWPEVLARKDVVDGLLCAVQFGLQNGVIDFEFSCSLLEELDFRVLLRDFRVLQGQDLGRFVCECFDLLVAGSVISKAASGRGCFVLVGFAHEELVQEASRVPCGVLLEFPSDQKTAIRNSKTARTLICCCWFDVPKRESISRRRSASD
jgi:hypothetical protein